ncbi:glutaminyl-peptide cyclotransferase [Streptomyces sp. NPDC005122]
MHRVEHLRVKVLKTSPHDPQAFTQGLEMAGDTLHEGTDISVRSSARTGPWSEKPTIRTALPAPLFGKGITVLGRTPWHLTWRNRTAIERDVKTLMELRPVPSRRLGLCLERAGHQLASPFHLV